MTHSPEEIWNQFKGKKYTGNTYRISLTFPQVSYFSVCALIYDYFVLQ